MKKLLKDDILKRLTVTPGKKISLKRDFDPGEKLGLDKENATRQLEAGVKQLAELQDKLYAQDTRSLLLIFQAMDAAGKDGTIKHVMSGLNPQGCQVFSFKAPSSEELDHDYLWRTSKALPERGRIGIFNRSYYEEVLVVRVHPEILARQRLPEQLKDKGIWKRRFQEINNFERYLTDNGTTILKFFLNVSKAEQKRRFLGRIAEPEKNWKFSGADVMERAHWNEYMEAYEDCLRNTSTKWAPWYVIPADFKPATRLAVAYVITEKLREMGLHYPVVSDAAYAELARVKALLERE